MTDLIKELKALKEKATPGPWEIFVNQYACGLQVDGGASFAAFWPEALHGHKFPYVANATLVAHLINHLPTILAKLEEGERMREALGRLVSEYDDDGEHGKHAYERECPLCCAIEDARKFTALESTHDH